MSLKIEFVESAEKGEKLAQLCREFGVSRTTGHKWMRRFRRPKAAPLATTEELVLTRRTPLKP